MAPVRSLPEPQRRASGRSPYQDLQAISGIMPFGLRHYWKGHFLHDLDAGGDRRGRRRRWRRARPGHSLHAARGDHAAGPAHEPRGRRGVRPAGGALERVARSAIWEDPADDDAQIAWARRTRRRAPAVVADAGPATATTRQSTSRPSGSGRAFGTERFERLRRVKRALRPGQRVPVQPQHPAGRGRLSQPSGASGSSGASRASSGRTSRVSRPPPARATSCWTRSSASRSSRSQRCWRATPRSYSASDCLERLAAGLQLRDRCAGARRGRRRTRGARSRRQSRARIVVRHRAPRRRSRPGARGAGR